VILFFGFFDRSNAVVRPDTPALNYVNLISVLLLWTLIDRRKRKVPYDDNIRFCHFGSLLSTFRKWFDGDFAETGRYMLFCA
jgi:hypothetical protein